MIDNCKVNEFIRRFYKAVNEKSMTEFYLLHERFERLSEKEKLAALLNIVFYNSLRDSL
jgi:hypothetical protein